VDENYRILVVVVVFVTKINLFSSTKIFVFVVVGEKTLIQSTWLVRQLDSHCTDGHQQLDSKTTNQGS